MAGKDQPVSPMAPSPRRRLDPETRKTALLEAAFAVFTENGFAGARIEDVAKRAGVAKGLVLFYFKRKDQLFEAVIRHLLAPDLFASIDATLARDDVSAEDSLHTLLRALYQHLVGNVRSRELLRLIIAEGPKFPALSEFYFQEVLVRGVQAVEQTIARGIKRGEFRPSAAQLQPQMVHGAAIMAMLWSMIFADRHQLDLEACLASQLDLLLHGLLRMPTS